jgi:hypothetical protein
MRTVLLGSFDVLMPVMRSDRFIFDFDEQVRGGLRSSVRSEIERKGDVGKKGVSHHRRGDRKPSSGLRSVYL